MSYVKELFELIKKDKEKNGIYDRYPVRFLFTKLSSNTITELSELQEMFVNESIVNKAIFNDLEIIKLSSLLNHDDAWITKQRLYNLIVNLNPEKDYFILGFSELARFYSKADLQALVLSFMTDIESASKKYNQRIYFICFSLLEKLNEVLKSNGRNASINPIIYHHSFTESDSISVYYANTLFDKTSLGKNVILKSSEWLSLYEKNNMDYSKGIVCLSDTLVSIYERAKPDNFVEVYKIDSYYSLLTRMYGVNIPYEFDNKYDNDFWKELFELAKKKGYYSIKSITTYYFQVQSITEQNFMSLFLSASSFGKKLLSIYVFASHDNIKYSDYLQEILKINNDDNFARFLHEIVTNFNNLSGEIYMESRRFYINQLFGLDKINRDFNQTELLKSINDSFNSFLISKIYVSNIEDEDISIISPGYLASKYNKDIEYIKNVIHSYFDEFFKKIVIGEFKVEQYILMNLLSNSFISISEAIDVYNDFADYLGRPFNSYVDDDINWVSQYIFEYKKSKLLSKATPGFLELSKKNSEEFVYSWYMNSKIKHQQDLIAINAYDKLFVLDGVGVEYFDYIIALLKKLGKYIKYANYAKSYLPSITSINKLNLANYDGWISDFDKERIHGSLYSATKTIPDSLDFLKEMIEVIIINNPTSTICITADHGATCQSKLIETTKTCFFKDSNHEGRCMEIDNEGASKITKSTDYFIYSDANTEKKYVIALNNVSLSDKPIRECHGGATVEECFVPCIVFSNNGGVLKYQFEIIKNVVNGLDHEVAIKISPKPLKSPSYEDEYGNCGQFNERNGEWVMKVHVVAKQKIKVIIGDYESNILVESSSGINTKGEDGFDD